MSRALKWCITIAAGAGVFASGCWLCLYLGYPSGDAIGLAAIPSALLTLPLAWWAGRERAAHPPALGSNSEVRNTMSGNASAVVQVRDIHGDVHVHAEKAPTAADGQVVVGLIPHEPPNFQPPWQVETLAGLSGEICVVCAVTGQRGVGKTQVAAAYARRRVRDGWLVAWISAESADLLQAGMTQLADRLGLRSPEDDADTTVARVRDYLQTRRAPALLVFDNLAAPDAVKPHLPAAGAVQVVITSTDRGTERVGRAVPVDVFTEETALNFLQEATGIDDIDGARQVAHELGFLPLALTQAAPRIRIARSYASYLAQFRRFPVDQYLIRRDGDSYPLGVATVILMALESFYSAESTTDSELLDGLAVLSPDGVSREILAVEQEASSVDEALARLHNASVVELAGPGEQAVIMHRLVQRVVRDRCRTTGSYKRVMLREAERLDQLTFDTTYSWAWRSEGDELVRQIEALWDNVDKSENIEVVAEILELRIWAFKHLAVTALLARAIPLAEAVYNDARSVLGEDHLHSLTSANELAFAYRSAGRLDKAIALYEQNFADIRRVLGEDDPITLISANNLAFAYESAWRLDEAIPLLEQTLADRRRVLGEDHPDTLSSANNLAGAYTSAERLDEAIPLLERTLADRRRVLGEDHPNTLTSANNLAGAYESTGYLDEAISIYRKVLADRRRVLGEDHPDTLTSANNLAGVYRSKGRPGEAISLFEKTFADIRRVLGDEHPKTLTSANNLAMSYQSVGRLDEAVSLLGRTLADRRRVLGEDHPDTLTSANNLAAAYRSAGRLDRAILLYEQTLANAGRVLGEDHPLTGTVRGNLEACRPS
ncbi:tetratricopeptide repeat protein [Amycolatopsis sp. NPDC021455]|uniref:tetratricopeptide repeat protein n=1 Tax=Amycolatopsis sp. NPDC021455 TaxID=3154901 RepID=UPI0033D77EF5